MPEIKVRRRLIFKAAPELKEFYRSLIIQNVLPPDRVIYYAARRLY